MKGLLAAAALVVALHAGAAGGVPTLPPVVSSPSGLSIPGKFIWFDLVTPDAAAAQAFYGKVFGWTFQGVAGAEDYVVFAAEDRLIGGIFQPVVKRDAPASTRWLGFVSVADIETAVPRLEGLGFTTLLPAKTVPDRGVQAIVRDPQGAIVGLLQSASGDPPDVPVGPGEFFWVDLLSRDTQASAAGYAAVGYQVVPADEDKGDRLLLESQGYARAGITPLPPEGKTPFWLPYVQVEDVAATVAAAQAAGGRLLRAPDPAVLGGNVAVVSDPLGGVIGIIHWTPVAEDQP